MIPQPVINRWRRHHPWVTDEQVEQDLLLSQLAILIGQPPPLTAFLAWRVGTCLHKLHLPAPRRYSVDLDYVLVDRAGPTGWLVDELRAAAAESPLDVVSTSIDRRGVRMDLGGASIAGSPISVKIEVNTDEVNSILGLVRMSHTVDTRWWSGSAELLTFAPAELVGTKFRALAQRRKGRDLWDLWLARRELAITDDELARAGEHYLHASDVSPATFRQRLAAHADHHEFRSDLDLLVAGGVGDYDPVAAARELILWSDLHIDPVANQRRSVNAVRRDQQRWARFGWTEDAERCPHHDVTADNVTRCQNWYQPRDHCPDHS